MHCGNTIHTGVDANFSLAATRFLVGAVGFAGAIPSSDPTVAVVSEILMVTFLNRQYLGRSGSLPQSQSCGTCALNLLEEKLGRTRADGLNFL